MKNKFKKGIKEKRKLIKDKHKWEELIKNVMKKVNKKSGIIN
jgi:hypothetical protein